jgi:hypothetical protein
MKRTRSPKKTTEHPVDPFEKAGGAKANQRPVGQTEPEVKESDRFVPIAQEGCDEFRLGGRLFSSPAHRASQ